MKLLTALRLASSGLSVQRLRLNISAMNLANADVTRTLTGEPYRAQNVVVSASQLPDELEGDLSDAGLKLVTPRVTAIVEDQSPFREVYDPSHPDADKRGIVRYPNVDVLTEMVELLSASRAYEANLSVVSVTKSMALKTLEILK
ncbi:flagellar basal-body rod protein FlgC [Thermodesulfatator indicus DSM 15286]|uniref:Flagellar basal-body rod protein FlgC n=1 Tax=Thermodesulfatator indicus (strain DSM 15286 / JCM 11887 / CIR29812) TaxID=667014 RepID=F8ABX3_THEID|nr:flagellar basal body rod protein FlgC [Thermodesulfatator indicus]AEH45665.1 flagellar basal-body rod protein FlgC [Thermodesulfatator indicus DSM 15286]